MRVRRIQVLSVGMAIAITLGLSGGVLRVTAAEEATTTAAPNTATQMTTQEKQDLQTRLQNRVTNLKTKLTTAQEARVKAKCKNAQGVISSMTAKVNTVQSKRTEVYGAAIARLSQLSNRLEKQNINSDLSEQTAALKTKVEAYDQDLATYKQSVNDLAAMDCVQNPAAFQASLDAARSSLAKVRTDAAAIRDYSKNTIKPTLESIRAQLQTTTSTEGNR